MKVEVFNKKVLKSKTYLSKEDITKFVGKQKFKLTIYYETIIFESPLEESYINSNSY